MTVRVRHPGAAAFVPDGVADLRDLAAAAQQCRGCDLYANATQTVFGRGAPRARLLLAGEQPGDVEDREGEPFIGPAGHVLDDALAEAGLDRSQVYVTNAVKHFRWKPASRGKRRLHEKPTRAEVVACRPWLEAECAAVDPSVVVALGATAVSAMFGPSVHLSTSHRQRLEWQGRTTVTTIHPSAVLRAPDAAERREMYEGLAEDLAFAARLIED